MTRNDEAGLLNKLIVALEGVTDAQRDSTKTQNELRQGLGELTGVVHEQSDAIRDLAQIVAVDRQTSAAADKKLNERVDRIARESGRKVVVTALQYLVPVLTLTGAGVGWLLVNGPDILEKWAHVHRAIWP